MHLGVRSTVKHIFRVCRTPFSQTNTLCLTVPLGNFAGNMTTFKKLSFLNVVMLIVSFKFWQIERRFISIFMMTFGGFWSKNGASKMAPTKGDTALRFLIFSLFLPNPSCLTLVTRLTIYLRYYHPGNATTSGKVRTTQEKFLPVSYSSS